jgi:hypothetical protein
MKIDDKQEISAVESARRLGVGLDYLYSLLWTGKLPGRKVGKTCPSNFSDPKFAQKARPS